MAIKQDNGGSRYQFIECFYAPACTKNAPFQALVRGNPVQLCAEHFDAHEREARWIARGRPTAAQSIAKMRHMLRQPRITNLERAHLILAQDAPNMVAREWAEEYINRTGKGKPDDDENIHREAPF